MTLGPPSILTILVLSSLLVSKLTCHQFRLPRSISKKVRTASAITSFTMKSTSISSQHIPSTHCGSRASDTAASRPNTSKKPNSLMTSFVSRVLFGLESAPSSQRNMRSSQNTTHILEHWRTPRYSLLVFVFLFPHFEKSTSVPHMGEKEVFWSAWSISRHSHSHSPLPFIFMFLKKHWRALEGLYKVGGQLHICLFQKLLDKPRAKFWNFADLPEQHFKAIDRFNSNSSSNSNFDAIYMRSRIDILENSYNSRRRSTPAMNSRTYIHQLAA